jgi:hypothetical protein
MGIATAHALTRRLLVGMPAGLARAARIGTLAGAVLGAGAAWAETELEPGRWALHVDSTTNGRPDPVQDTEECLAGDQLKDLGSYFAPSLEGGEADCRKTRQPSSDPRKVEYRMQCTGAGFSLDATTTVTIESARRFTVAIRMSTRAETESAVVVADAEGRWKGPCEVP